MRWQESRRSENVEDQRGRRIATGPAIGGGVAIVILLVGLLLGGDPATLLETIGNTATQQTTQTTDPAQMSEADARAGDFVAAVLGETEDVWRQIFAQNGATYQEPRLVLFSGSTQSACGYASAAVGPFYCSADQRVYLDTEFFSDLERQFGASGDFAQAYVIAHEIGHHVQNLLGTMDKVDALRQRASQREANDLSVRLELQADFFAGVWAHYADRTKNILEPGDIEEAMNAATAIGDDRIQKQTQGYVVPDAFTHGTSEQRTRWFRRGYETGDIRQGDTFSVAEP
ncbi:MAG TPA: neutral zinc metallopeptidase [Bacteroidota bacterium]|nr:neutral zinc metallopeptidase [Bacteroidota bacterium]